jgi:tetratricopeptide (TPR) repeat protein
MSAETDAKETRQTGLVETIDARLSLAPARVCTYLLLLALGVRLVYLSQYANSPFFWVLYLSQYANSPFFWVPALDALYHDLHAQEIARGADRPEAFFRAPAYAYFLGGIYRVFGHSYWAARIIQALLGSVSCVLLYQLGLRIFRPTAALIGAGAMALYGPLVFFDGELHSPVLEVFLDLAFLVLVIAAAENSQRPARLWLAAGLVLGLSTLTRPNILVAAPLALWWLWARSPAGNPRAAWAALFLGATLLFPALVTLRNWRVSGDPVFIGTQGGINLYLGNRPEADGFTPSTPRRYEYAGEYEDSVALYGRKAAEEALGRPLKASEAQAYWVRQVLSWWREHPAEALALTWKKWVLAWTHGEIRNNHAFDFVRAEFAPALWVCPFGFWFAGPLGILGMLLSWRTHPAARPLALFVLAYVASFVLFFVADRFRLPVVPPLLLFAGYAVVWLAQQPGQRTSAQAKPGAHLAGALGVLVALSLFIGVDWYRTVTPATRALDHWSAGNRSAKMGRFAEAQGQYRKALALDPKNAEIWLNLGAAQYQAGQAAEAARSFERVTTLDPRNASGFYNRAICELTLGRREQARPLLETALRLNPSHQGARSELQKLR